MPQIKHYPATLPPDRRKRSSVDYLTLFRDMKGKGCRQLVNVFSDNSESVLFSDNEYARIYQAAMRFSNKKGLGEIIVNQRVAMSSSPRLVAVYVTVGVPLREKTLTL